MGGEEAAKVAGERATMVEAPWLASLLGHMAPRAQELEKEQGEGRKEREGCNA
jgi:hypothetical protein